MSGLPKIILFREFFKWCVYGLMFAPIDSILHVHVFACISTSPEILCNDGYVFDSWKDLSS